MNDRGGFSIGYILLIGLLAYAAFKFYETQRSIAMDLRNRATAPPGVSYYCNLAVSQRPQQVIAAQNYNTCMSTPLGYAPAFGPLENNPSACQEVFF